MATIENRYGKWRVLIRRKGHNFSASFSSKDVAEIWAKYQEDLIDNMNNFNEIPENIINLEQCIELKLNYMIEKGADKRTISDFKSCSAEFKEIANEPIAKITQEDISRITQEMLGSIVKRGGNRANGTGKSSQCSPKTVLRKLRILASVFSYIIENGANIKNVAQSVCSQLQTTIKNCKEKNE